MMEHFGDHGYKVFGTGKIFHNNQEKNEVWKDGLGHMVDWGPWSWDGQKPGRGWSACASHQNLPQDWDAEMLFASLADIPDIPPNPETGAPGYRGWRHGDNTPFRYVSEDDRDLMNDELNAQWAAGVLAKSYADPFLLCVGIGRPHAPLVAPQKYCDLFPLEEIEPAVRKEGDLEDCAKAFREGHTSTTTWGFMKYRKIIEAGGEDLLKRWTQAYLACIAYADDQIGKVLDALEQGPHAQNTYVVLTSDNGYHMGEKEYLFKNSCWEESARVPLVVAGPRAEAGSECPTPVTLVDLFPTFNDLCALPMEVNAAPGGKALDGHVFTPLLENPTAGQWDGPPAAVTAVASDIPLSAGEPGEVGDQHWAVRTERYRYILYNSGEEELYDHEADPYEWTNLAPDSSMQGVKDEHRAILRQVTGR
jgi:arylsulfatase A-like enzyme